MILHAIKNFEVIGRDGSDVLKEASDLQPDLLIYELRSVELNGYYDNLSKLRAACSWTKIILFSANPIERESLQKFIGICDGYLQGPLLPGFLQKAVELACYSGHFFFLGSSRDITNSRNGNEADFLSRKLEG